MKDTDPRIEQALAEAQAAQKASYTPYSHFKMGAAVITDQGAVVRGSLVENVSLGLSMCAERAALFATVAQEVGKPEILALISRPTGGDLTWPCGACLQVAMELGGGDLLVVVTDGTTHYTSPLKDLAPKVPCKD